MEKIPSVEECFFGSVTLGERGQVVIPADARKEIDIHAGDKLLVFRHPFHAKMLMIGKMSDVQQFFQEMARHISEVESHLEKISDTEE